MAFDQATRNRLQRFVNDARRVLEEEFTRQLQNDFGLDPNSGTVAELASLRHINDAQRETARILRDTLAHYTASGDMNATQGLDRIVREQAFTVLNRLAALRMAEARGLLVESVGNGFQAKGFQLYARLVGTGLGETGDAYRVYLFSVFDELAQDLPGLFDRYSPQGRLFPREAALLHMLQLINDDDIVPLWGEDETIGWIYQYFNSKEERKAMRDASQAPRNSRELAVRNQFFTPRYVVEFLVDNTLGRLWFNATGRQTGLRERCQYLLVRPDEAPQAATQLRDPRTLKLLDPACGSMHFGLYAFDLFAEIYREAWAWEQQHGPGSLDVSTQPQAALKPLSQTYKDEATFLRDVPRLIIEHNIYGVDIDPRAAQIASLALWLRAQRAWHDAGVKAKDRPLVGRGHVVAATAPPAERELREQFAATLDHLDAELFEQTLQLLKGVPELGVLLQAERELPQLIKQVFGEHGSLFKEADMAQWHKAETRLRQALHDFTRAAQASYQGRLFAQDALEGLRLIDLTREVFDVVVMNPPFGDISFGSKDYLFAKYSKYKADLYAIFVVRGLQLLAPGGQFGAITSRTGFFLTSLKEWREVLLSEFPIGGFLDLGLGVLDSAMVEACCFVASNSNNPQDAIFINATAADDKGQHILQYIDSGEFGSTDLSTFKSIPDSPFAYWAHSELRRLFSTKNSLLESGFRVRQGLGSSDNFRFLRLWWEVSPEKVGLGKMWCNYAKGGGYMPFWGDQDLLVLWNRDGREIKQYSAQLYGTWSKQITNVDYYGRKGLTYSSRTSSEFSPRILPIGCAFDTKGSCIFDEVGPDNEFRLLKLLTIIQSRVFRSLVNMCVATSGDTARSYSEALIEKMPVPELNNISSENLKDVLRLIQVSMEGENYIETTRGFHIQNLLEYKPESLLSKIKREISSANSYFKDALDKIDLCVARAYDLDDQIYQSFIETPSHHYSIGEELPSSSEAIICEMLSWTVGIVFGRFDWRLATGERAAPAEPEPFDPLPAKSPGMLPDGAEPFHAHSGILVDDPVHPHDLARLAEEVLARIDAPVPDNLRRWLQRDFFAFHLKRYSKSRRKAPIYWPLSTTSGSYTLWVYYPSLSSQTLYTAINDFIEPKLKQVGDDVTALRSKGAARSRDDEKQFEALQVFELELIELRDTLLKLAPTYQPKHDDGVQISAAPLWPLFRHKPWQKVLKDTWTKLEKGDYDWAHLAMNYWPERVREKCKTDKSLAIAHGLEHLYIESEAAPKKARGRKKTGGDE